MINRNHSRFYPRNLVIWSRHLLFKISLILDLVTDILVIIAHKIH